MLADLSRQTKIREALKTIGFPHQRILETPTNTRLSKKILRELQALQDLEILDPTKDEEPWEKFLENFDWEDFILASVEIARIEDLLVKFYDIFARHRFDIGMKEEFKMKLSPKNNSPVYSRSLPGPLT